MQNDPHRIADILEASPIVARLALTAPNESLRRRAAETLGAIVARRLNDDGPVDDGRQMMLPIGDEPWG